MSQPIARFNGAVLYVDTMIFHIFLRDSESNAKPLLLRVQTGEKMMAGLLYCVKLCKECTLPATLTTPINPLHHRRHPRQLLRAEAGSRGETETVGKEFLCNLPPDAFVSRKDGLEVHRLPDGTGFDVFRLQR